MALTRRGALALIDGQLDEAEHLIGEASTLGERIGEPDTGNVRMSQLLGLARARGEPERLRATAAEAIRWWVGVPSHAHAVAAGFLALAGEPDDLAAARRALDTVLALDTWRSDRSYLWSVFVGGMTTAAVRLRDGAICADLLAELEPMTDACGVNGALVCFMGSNAHWAGMLAAALGRPEDARRWLAQALAVHQRLGAPAWEAETCLELASLDPEGRTPNAPRTGVELGLRSVAARLTAASTSAHPHSRTRRMPSCAATASSGWSATAAARRTSATSKDCPISPCCSPAPASTSTCSNWPGRGTTTVTAEPCSTPPHAPPTAAASPSSTTT